jgi:hypothetical protein
VSSDERQYYAERARIEREQAAASSNPHAASIHEKLASLYEKLVELDERAPPASYFADHSGHTQH